MVRLLGFIAWQPFLWRERPFDGWVFVERGRSSCCFRRWAFSTSRRASTLKHKHRVQFLALLSWVQLVCFLICSHCCRHFYLSPLYVFHGCVTSACHSLKYKASTSVFGCSTGCVVRTEGCFFRPFCVFCVERVFCLLIFHSLFLSRMLNHRFLSLVL